MNKLNAAIFGASGYTGEELVRRLARHPLVEIVAMTSRQSAGKVASDIFPWLDRRSAVGKIQFETPEITEPKKPRDRGRFSRITAWSRGRNRVSSTGGRDSGD